MSFGFHSDIGLVAPETTRLVIEVIGDGYVDLRTVVGSADATVKAQAASNPGVDPIEVAIDDTGAGTGFDPSMVQLALTQGALAAATPGASLSLGNTVQGGVANAVEVWARVTTGATVETRHADLRLLLTELVEVPV